MNISSRIEEEKFKNVSLNEEKSIFIKNFEIRVCERFEKERFKRKELERRYTNLIEERFNSMKMELTKESKDRFEAIENLKTYLEVNI